MTDQRQNATKTDSERLDEVEERLHAQEHRPYWIFRNFFKRKSEPQHVRCGIESAFLWWWIRLLTPTSAQGVATYLAVVTIIMTIWQLKIAEQQNALMAEQTQEEKEAALIASGDAKAALYKDNLDSFLRQLQDLDSVEDLDASLRRRLRTFVNNLEPYHRRNQTGEFVGRQLSPEKGVIITELARLTDDLSSIISVPDQEWQLDFADIAQTSLEGKSFYYAWLEGSKFDHGRLRTANFELAYLVGATFVSAQLDDANFTRADLSLADLSGADLSGANFTKADLTGTDLTNAIVDGPDWISRTTESDAPVGFDVTKWTVVEEDGIYRMKPTN